MKKAATTVEYAIIALLIINLVISGVAISYITGLSGDVKSLSTDLKTVVSNQEKMFENFNTIASQIAEITGTVANITAPGAPAAPAGAPIKIGIIVPLTGPNAYNGWLMSRGALVAQKYINDRGGVLGRPIEVIIEDGMGKAEPSILAAEKLITVDKVVALAGFYKTLTTKAVMESVIAKYKIPMFTAGWSDSITAAHNKYVFRAGPMIGAQLDQWAEFIGWISDQTGRKKFAAYSENDEYGIEFQSGLLDRLKKAGKVEIVADIYHDLEATDFMSDLIKIKESGAEIFWTATVTSAVMTMIKQAAQVGLKDQAIIASVADGFYYTEEYKNTVGEAGDHVIITAFHKPGIQYTDLTPIMDDIYRELGYGDKIEYYITLQVCEDVLLIAKAIELAGSTDPDAIVNALETHTFIGPWGVVKFSMEPTGPYYHQWTPPMLFEQYQNLELKVIYPPELAEVEPILPPAP